MADESKKNRSIPAWQQTAGRQQGLAKAADGINKVVELEHDLIEVAREFLKDDAIKNAPRDEKIEFLKNKGLADEVIQKLMVEDDEKSTELKTIHDTTANTSSEPQSPTPSTSQTAPEPVPVPQPVLSPTPRESRSDMPPIITYPEFLLQPQKPPPIITVPRLVNAAYIFAGVSALTWGASKYLIEPMLQTLTEARHDFADGTLQDLEKFNEKLEGVVSHVPYIASSATKRLQDANDDIESVDSDPTELFHRDIATQTTPGLSRSSSVASLTRNRLDPTVAQAERLSGLSYSLRTLTQSLQYANDKDKTLQDTVDDFQKKLDSMESSFGIMKNDYYGSSGIYASAANDSKKSSGKDSEAQKFKQEIRALKGAFLSSRNFPTARPAGVVGGHGQR